MQNVKDVEFEKVELLDAPCYLTKSRLDRNSVPEDYNYYELAGNNTLTSDAGDFFDGALLSPKSFPLTFIGGYYCFKTVPENWKRSGEFVKPFAS